jgi:hypothetical protein
MVRSAYVARTGAGRERQFFALWELAEKKNFLQEFVAHLCAQVPDDRGADGNGANVARRVVHFLPDFGHSSDSRSIRFPASTVVDNRIVLVALIDALVNRWRDNPELDLRLWFQWIENSDEALKAVLMSVSSAIGLSGTPVDSDQVGTLASFDPELVTLVIKAALGQPGREDLIEKSFSAVVKWWISFESADPDSAKRLGIDALASRASGAEWMYLSDPSQALFDAFGLLSARTRSQSSPLFLRRQVARDPASFIHYADELNALLPEFRESTRQLFVNLLTEVSELIGVNAVSDANIARFLFDLWTVRELDSDAQHQRQAMLKLAVTLFADGSVPMSKEWQLIFVSEGFQPFVNQVLLAASLPPGTSPRVAARVGSEAVRSKQNSLREVLAVAADRRIINSYGDWQTFSDLILQDLAGSMIAADVAKFRQTLDDSATDGTFPPAVIDGYVNEQVFEILRNLELALQMIENLIPRSNNLDFTKVVAVLASMLDKVQLVPQEAKALAEPTDRQSTRAFSRILTKVVPNRQPRNTDS